GHRTGRTKTRSYRLRAQPIDLEEGAPGSGVAQGSLTVNDGCVAMRILYSGEIQHGSTTEMRLRALVGLGHEVIGVTTATLPPPQGLRRFAARVMHKLRRPIDLAGANAKLRSEAENGRFDVFWIDKGLTIRPDTIDFVKTRQPGIVVIGYSPDDMANPVNQS